MGLKALATHCQDQSGAEGPDVSATLILPALACGVLLGAAGLALWDGFRQTPGLARAVDSNAWLAGALLSIGALLAWQGNHSLSGPALSGIEGPAPHLILMAALAALPLPRIRRRRSAPWSETIRILPALALAGVGLFWTPGPAAAGAGNSSLALVELGVLVCAGLGAGALGQALSEMAESTPHLEWPFAAAYALLTLLAGGMALVNLGQRGSVWDGTAGQSGLAGAWLAWSAAWWGPRRPNRLRAGLIAAASLLLIALAAGYPMLD
jgi:hypothetical protein